MSFTPRRRVCNHVGKEVLLVHVAPEPTWSTLARVHVQETVLRRWVPERAKTPVNPGAAVDLTVE